MGYGSRKSKVYRHLAYHPYKQNIKPKYAQSADHYISPSFADIEFEIIKDSPTDSPLQWVINETGDAYAFSVQGNGLKSEDVEVKLELAGQLEFATSSDSQFYSRSLLTILCERMQYFESSFGELTFQNSDNTLTRCWKHGRRFKLPVDASPETATAAHDNGILTVVIPRRPLDSDTCSFEGLHTNPSLVDNTQFSKPFFNCGQWSISEKQKRIYTLEIGSKRSQNSYDFPIHGNFECSGMMEDYLCSSMNVDGMEMTEV